MPTALVTGGSRGIGAAIVQELAEHGFDVAFAYRSRALAAKDVAAAARRTGRRIAPIEIDLAKPNAPEQLLRSATDAIGDLDALVVNAAVWASESMLELTPETYDLVQDTNVRSAFFLVQAVALHMIDREKRGRMVIVTSRGARRPRRGSSVYSITKAAQVTLARCAAIELGQYGITVNEVAPGPTETEMNRALRLDPDKSAALSSAILLERFGKPVDVAHAVRFLLSDDAAFVTGATIAVDGGAAIG